MSIFTRIFIVALWCNLLIPTSHAISKQEVTILADDSYPPYSFVENGQLQGMYVDIVKEAAKLLTSHYKVKLVAYPWKRALHELKQGSELALIPPYKLIEKRPYIWPYSTALMKEVVVAYCQKDINLFEYIQLEKINTKTPLNVGINAGYLILNQKLEQAQTKQSIVIHENKNTHANMMKLYYKRLDCYLNDRNSTLWEFAKISKERNFNFDNIKEALVVMTQTAHIGYTNNPTHTFLFKDDFILRMDRALSNVLSSKKYQDIINRYISI